MTYVFGMYINCSIYMHLITEIILRRKDLVNFVRSQSHDIFLFWVLRHIDTV
jgi:hypothetical protein